MKIENEKVSLTKSEADVTEVRDVLVAGGESKKDAARMALAQMSGRVTAKFVEWLSDGTLTLHNGEVEEVKEQVEVETAPAAP